MNSSFQRIVRRLPPRSRSLLATCIYGVGAGLSAVAFQLGINWVYTNGIHRLSHEPLGTFFVGSLIVLVSTALVVGWLLNSFCREAAGSGVPQLKLAFWKDFGFVPARVIWVKFLAGILSVGGGSSLGREGPSVQLAGAVGSNLAAWTGEAKQRRRASAAAGASAGLAAAFNTPIAATTFVLEEIIGDLNSRFLGAILLASVLGAFVVHAIIGKQPSFSLLGVESPTWRGYLLTPVVAGLAGTVGVHFQRLSLGLRFRMKVAKEIPRWIFPSFGALITWALGSIVFWRTGHLGVFSLGYDDLSSALSGDLGWQLAIVLLLAKFLATVSCYGFGGCGGIFSPTLFFGGMTGIAVAGLAGIGWHISRGDTLALAVVGMSACLGAVVFAPVTGILMVFEMTHEFALVPALMLGALVSQTIGRKMNRENFYDALLAQDGHRLEHVRPPRDLQGWRELPVSAVANFSPKVLPDVTPSSLFDALGTPYERFPVVIGGTLAGIITRSDASAALSSGRKPSLNPPITCRRDQTVGELQSLLIESDLHLVVVLDRNDGQVIGLVTLHDLLRAEATFADTSADNL